MTVRWGRRSVAKKWKRERKEMGARGRQRLTSRVIQGAANKGFN